MTIKMVLNSTKRVFKLKYRLLQHTAGRQLSIYILIFMSLLDNVSYNSLCCIHVGKHDSYVM